jgi:hypothetical protein
LSGRFKFYFAAFAWILILLVSCGLPRSLQMMLIPSVMYSSLLFPR